MFVYRIVKDKKRTTDLSGTGAFKAGGRWNSKGVYMLYTSENSSLAYLETLAHFEEGEKPRHLYIMKIEVHDRAPVFELDDDDYPEDWMQIDNFEIKEIGDRLMAEKKYLAVKVRSAVNRLEYNFLLNPLHPRFGDWVRIAEVTGVEVDERFTA